MSVVDEFKVYMNLQLSFSRNVSFAFKRQGIRT